MADHIETLLYQRTLIKNDGASIVLLASTNPASILIQSQFRTMNAISVHVPGELGADLIVASSSAYTAATQGMEYQAKVGTAIIDTITGLKGRHHVRYRGNNGGFVVDIEMMPAVLASLQTLLNDITGEYRRRVEQIENNMSPR